MILYIHGLNSSSQSYKARLMEARLAELGRGAEFRCPDLPHRPAAAIALLETLLAGAESSATTLVGSSLGGYYATHLAERHACRAVLLNPAVRPYASLAQYVGPQQNLYTGERYELTPAHFDELHALEVAAVTPQRYLLIAATGDEVLDYREAVERYRGCRQIVIQGSDHGLSDFGNYLETVLGFAGVR